MEREISIRKKSGHFEEWQPEKIEKAIKKSADRVAVTLTPQEVSTVVGVVKARVEDYMEEHDTGVVSVEYVHGFVEMALKMVNKDVAESYMDYRNWVKKEAEMNASVWEECQALQFIGDKSNANADSAMVSTKRVKKLDILETAQYNRYFLTSEERIAASVGYIYVHDKGARLDTSNCFDRDTRFITSAGVKSFRDFKDGDVITVLTHKGNWKKATVHAYGWQKIQEVVFKRASGNDVSVFCTENHRWILKDGSETTSLKIGDKLIAAPNVFEINWNEMSREEKNLWCLGFGIADGSITKDNNLPCMHLRLCGKKTEYAERFSQIGYTVTFPDHLNGDALVRMLDVSSKEIPFLRLNCQNIRYFMNGWLAADGNKSLSDSEKYRGLQVTGGENEKIYDLLNISGCYVTNVTDLTGQKTNYGVRTSDTKSYGFHTAQNDRTWFVKDIKPAKLNPKAQVWCLEVEDDHSFILENGIPTGNCCLFDIRTVLEGGFEMGNMWYNEPKTLDTAFDVIGDITLMAASQQYGGFTLPEIDSVLEKYAEKSFQRYYKEYFDLLASAFPDEPGDIEGMATEKATEKVIREMEQGFQGWEYKFNTVASSRGDYPFITVTFGLCNTMWGRELCKAALRVRKNGQGKKGHKKPVLFPKLVFLYDENLHGKGMPMEDVFEEGIRCSSKCMYPDWLSLTGEGYLPEMYQKYGKAISPMGCRAFLSPWYEKGGMHPADDDDKPVFIGRFNIGVVSLNLPMIYRKSEMDNADFYETLDYYLEMIRKLHLRTYEHLSHMKASMNTLGFCEGGFYRGHLGLNDSIAPCLEAATASFGITALNELQQIHNQKSLVEDGQFALEVMQHIVDKINQFKEEDGKLYAIYGTPAESLCSTQIKQFRKEYGVITNVSDRMYVSNSFHCHVSENISPIQKQDLEGRFWNYFNGGKIQYVRYPISYNLEAIRVLVRRAMKKGFYEGVNLSLAYCDDCGHEELEMDVCPVCGSKNLTKIDRMNGYLAYSRVHGDTRLNEGKMAEIAERVSM